MRQYGNYAKYQHKPSMELVLMTLGKDIDITMKLNGLDIFDAEKLEIKTRYIPKLTYYNGTQFNPNDEWDIGWVATFKEADNE